MSDIDQLLDRFRRRDRRALSRLLTLAARGERLREIRAALSEIRSRQSGGGGKKSEVRSKRLEVRSQRSDAADVDEQPTTDDGQRTADHSPLTTHHAPLTIAFTGGGGVGKSSLIGRLVEVIRRRGRTVAVLACDPESPLTGGALLGDRLRMSPAAEDEGVFVRSLPTAAGGQALAENLDVMIELLAAWPFDVVLLETVGSGQGDTAVRDLVDVVVLMLQPESGDDIQWEKAGLLEVADLLVVNKADLPGAEEIIAQLERELHLPGCRPVPIVRTSAAKKTGLDELCKEIESLPPQADDRLARQRGTRRLLQLVRQRLGESFRENSEMVEQIVVRWVSGEIDDDEAFRAALRTILD